MISTKRLLLRRCTVQDALALCALMTPDISRWVAVWPVPLGALDAERIIVGYLKDPHAMPFVVTRDGGVIGWLKIDDLGDGVVELGYWLGQDHHRQGLAQEMARAAMAYAFDTMGARDVVAGAQAENQPSIALFAKLGMAYRETRAVFAPARNREETCVFWGRRADDDPLAP